jgi:hypothetical protein
MTIKTKFSNGTQQSRTALSLPKTRSSFDLSRRAAARAGIRRAFAHSSA